MKHLSLMIFLIVFLSAKPTFSQPKGIFVDFKQIEKVKVRIEKENPHYMPAYRALIEDANAALQEGPFSVMDKKRTPPSGDKHDYLSMGPYWWPDPSKPDGLPYIRKDGEVNPETRGDNVDRTSARNLFANVELLGWAYYFTEDEKYAKKALELIEAWFVNPETRMNPNLDYAQGIPGRTEGRGIGIIDWARINSLITPFQILEANHILKGESKNKLKAWFDEYHNWLLTSKNGRFEDDYFNNHGTWYDVQVVGIELWLDKTEMAKKRLENAKTKRIASQIEPDGSQPHELARTKSLGYSTMNLRGFIHLANLGEKAGVDLWNFNTEDGRSIHRALEFLLPFAKGKKEWKHHQLGRMEEAVENLKINFLMAARATGKQEYLDVIKIMKDSKTEPQVLLYPVFDLKTVVNKP